MSPVVQAAAAIPAAPLLLPTASPAQPAVVRDAVAALRADVRATIRQLPAADVFVLVASGPRGFNDEARATLAPFGVAHAEVELPVPADLVATATRLTQWPQLRGEVLRVSHSVLALLLYEVLGEVPVLPVSVPPGAGADVLASIGSTLIEVVRAHGCRANIIATGDLSAKLHARSPGYLDTTAEEFDRTMVRALAERDDEALARCGPRWAEQVQARSWTPLAVLSGVVAAARLAPTSVRYHAPLGVGQVVADYRPTDETTPLTAPVATAAAPPAER